MSNTWMSKKEHDVWGEIEHDFLGGLLFGFPKREPKYEDKVKYAYVIIDGHRTMVGVHNEDMKAYALRSDCPTWEIPLVPIEYDSFERWCTSMDL